MTSNSEWEKEEDKDDLDEAAGNTSGSHNSQVISRTLKSCYSYVLVGELVNGFLTIGYTSHIWMPMVHDLLDCLRWQRIACMQNRGYANYTSLQVGLSVRL